jgi:hypothetical protein
MLSGENKFFARRPTSLVYTGDSIVYSACTICAGCMYTVYSFSPHLHFLALEMEMTLARVPLISIIWLKLKGRN